MPSASLLHWQNDRMPRLTAVDNQCAASLALAPSQPNLVDENLRGYVTFATRGANSRTTQLFINLRDNPTLDSSGFAPIGRVVDDGMDVVDKIYSGYGESISRGGNGPDATRIQGMGNEYLVRQFPQLDYVKTARVEK